MPRRPDKDPPQPFQESLPAGVENPPGADVDDLIREIQAGSSAEQHFRQLFRLFFPSAVYFFVNRGFSKTEAEDLAQDVLVGVYKGIGSFRFEASVETWVFRILTNVLRNALRRRTTFEGRADKISLDRTDEQGEGERWRAEELEDPSAGPLQRILADERTRLLHEAVDQLPPRMRQCVLLRVGQGLRYREIAEVLDLGVSSVKTHLGAARARLEPLLEKHFDVFVF